MYPAVLAFAILLLAVGGCAPRDARPPRPAVDTSYPSPDYPPQEAGKPAAAQAAPQPPVLPPHPVPVPPPAPPAQAQPTGTPQRQPAAEAIPFSAMDTDHNGRVTLEEWRNYYDQQFHHLDKNDDNVLTPEEVGHASPVRHTGKTGHPTP